jgi:hypothetical protein
MTKKILMSFEISNNKIHRLPPDFGNGMNKSTSTPFNAINMNSLQLPMVMRVHNVQPGCKSCGK